MTEQESIEIIKTEKACVLRNIKHECNKDCFSCDLLKPDDDILVGYDRAIHALEEVQQYRTFEERLKKIYGDCPELLETALEIVVKHLEAPEGVDLPEPIFKARLLTDGEVDKWEAYKQLGTVEELREAMEKQRWISCSERLPERDGIYICTQENYDTQEKRLISKSVEFVEFYNGKWKRAKFLKVIAWMPLPEPYIDSDRQQS